MTKHTILFLAANPLGTDRLALDREARAIQVELERSGHRDQFELVTRWAAEPLDVLRELGKLKPTVVHFSGHGSRGEPVEPRSSVEARRDVVSEPNIVDGDHQPGLFFHDTDGRPQLVSTAALEKAFGAAGSSVKLVVLNACYSDAQAEAMRVHVDYVVGTARLIRDDAARNFAIGFYGALGQGESVNTAYKYGCAAIILGSPHDSNVPKLHLRDGVEPNQLVLSAAAATITPVAPLLSAIGAAPTRAIRLRRRPRRPVLVGVAVAAAVTSIVLDRLVRWPMAPSAALAPTRSPSPAAEPTPYCPAPTPPALTLICPSTIATNEATISGLAPPHSRIALYVHPVDGSSGAWLEGDGRVEAEPTGTWLHVARFGNPFGIGHKKPLPLAFEVDALAFEGDSKVPSYQEVSNHPGKKYCSVERKPESAIACKSELTILSPKPLTCRFSAYTLVEDCDPRIITKKTSPVLLSWKGQSEVLAELYRDGEVVTLPLKLGGRLDGSARIKSGLIVPLLTGKYEFKIAAMPNEHCKSSVWFQVQ